MPVDTETFEDIYTSYFNRVYTFLFRMCGNEDLAEELTPGETHFDEDEFLAPVAVPLEELADRVMRGEIPDAKTQLAVLRVRELLRRRGEAGL